MIAQTLIFAVLLLIMWTIVILLVWRDGREKKKGTAMKDNDLISRSAAKEEILSWAVVINKPHLLNKEDALHVLDTLPAVDAETVFQHLDLMQEAFDMAKSTLAPAPAWISVKDRLPETESRCLVVRYDGVTKTSFIDILWFDKGTWWNRIFGGEYAVTHWMPLPEPPKED